MNIKHIQILSEAEADLEDEELKGSVTNKNCLVL
jgi:hypothetical protein